jgi:hypothetical protein
MLKFVLKDSEKGYFKGLNEEYSDTIDFTDVKEEAFVFIGKEKASIQAVNMNRFGLHFKLEEKV